MSDDIDLFVHAAGSKPKVFSGKRNETLRCALSRAGVIPAGAADVYAFVGECVAALSDDLDTESDDGQAPADLDLTIEGLGLQQHGHVHAHRCRHVAVEVHFNGTKKRRFSPATTIETVSLWARRRFRLDDAAGAEYVLQLCGTTDQPRPDVHLGELTAAGTCALCFDLVKEVTPQGHSG